MSLRVKKKKSTLETKPEGRHAECCQRLPNVGEEEEHERVLVQGQSQQRHDAAKKAEEKVIVVHIHLVRWQ